MSAPNAVNVLVPTGIWRDDTMRSLSTSAQRVLFLLITQREITSVGTLPLTMNRWAHLSANTSPHDIEQALRELVEAGFVLVDDTTEEVLVLSYLRLMGRDGQPNVLRAALKAADRIASPKLRSAALAGLQLPTDRDAKQPSTAALVADEVPDYEAPGTHESGRVSRWKPSPGRMARTRLAVFVRDQWTCKYCGQVFTPTTDDERSGRRAPMNGWDFLELDHVHPYSLGGGFTLDNLVAACSPCNRSKGNKIVQVSS